MSGEPLPPREKRRVDTLFEEALRLPRGQRAIYLAAATDDSKLRDEVMQLLSMRETVAGGLERPEPARLPSGKRVGPYRIRGHLGGGGMGEVYRAHDERLKRDVAVKVLHGRLDDEGARAAFEREARAIAGLSSSNVLAIYDVGDDDGLPYLVTELLAGETLRARLQTGRPSVAQAVDWGTQIALGLAAAHDAGLVHRDLKPENVFLLADGRLKILDFGLACARPGGPLGGEAEPVTHPGIIVGTAGYLAPEQARGQPVTPAADLFALGAILFEMLTGERAFRGETLVDTLRAMLDHEPPAPSSRRPGVPRWLDRAVARCVAKEAGARFQSARDLAFVLGGPLEEAAAASPAPRRRWALVLAAATAGALAAGALLWSRRDHAPAAPPARPAPLTFSGRDRAPTVSPDGRFLAFASDRDGRPRIWLQQLDVGREAVLTDGPDDAPRFSPGGGEVLFSRARPGGSDLYRVDLLGGEARKVVDDASEGDWSPDGQRVAFVRWHGDAAQGHPVLMVAGADGSGERELARLELRVAVRPRWSPDGRLIAVTGRVQQPGIPQTITLVPADGGEPRRLPAAARIGMVSAVAWDGPGALLYSQALSVTGNGPGSPARIVRQRIADGAVTTLLWSPETSLILERWPGHGVVFDTRSARQSLREVTIAGGGSHFLSHGTSTDRQPVVTPDGEQVIFSSNRGDNLDIWSIVRATGATRRLTDDPAQDWDPAVTPDGQHLLWSSNRSGNFEVWMADLDGAHPRQVTRDGIDAENPGQTADGQWIVYSSGAAGRAGIYRIRTDGTDARLLVPDVILPELSPDGRYVLFQSNRTPRLAVVGVASVADGTLLPFEIQCEVKRPSPSVLGRARWMPDGRSIAFVAQDEQGLDGVYAQDFAPGQETGATRRPLAGFDPDWIAESFAVVPPGDRIILADWEQRSQVVAATGLGLR